MVTPHSSARDKVAARRNQQHWGSVDLPASGRSLGSKTLGAAISPLWTKIALQGVMIAPQFYLATLVAF